MCNEDGGNILDEGLEVGAFFDESFGCDLAEVPEVVEKPAPALPPAPAIDVANLSFGQVDTEVGVGIPASFGVPDAGKNRQRPKGKNPNALLGEANFDADPTADPNAPTADNVPPEQMFVWPSGSKEEWESRILYLGKLDESLSEEAIRQCAEESGATKRVLLIRSRAAAFVQFYDLRAAISARAAFRASNLQSTPLDVQYSGLNVPEQDSNYGTLFCMPHGNPRDRAKDPNTDAAYTQLFSQYGDVKKLTCNKTRADERFVEFFDTRHAATALASVNGFSFNGVMLNVQFAQRPSRSRNQEGGRDERSGKERRREIYGGRRNRGRDSGRDSGRDGGYGYQSFRRHGNYSASEYNRDQSRSYGGRDYGRDTSRSRRDEDGQGERGERRSYRWDGERESFRNRRSRSRSRSRSWDRKNDGLPKLPNGAKDNKGTVPSFYNFHSTTS